MILTKYGREKIQSKKEAESGIRINTQIKILKKMNNFLNKKIKQMTKIIEISM